MKTKKFYRSKELWLLVTAFSMLMATTYGGWEPTGLVAAVAQLTEALAIPGAMVLRLFFTEGKLEL